MSAYHHVPRSYAQVELDTRPAAQAGLFTRLTWQWLVATGLISLLIAAAVSYAVTSTNDRASNNSGMMPVADLTGIAVVRRADLSIQTTFDGRIGHDDSPWPLLNQVSGTVTQEPAIESVLGQGDVLYRVNDQPIYLVFGTTPLWRSISIGTTGADVGEIKVALSQLIGTPDLKTSNRYTVADAMIVQRWQQAHGWGATGDIPFGEFIVAPSSVRVAGYKLRVGSVVQPGQEPLELTATQRVVRASVPVGIAVRLQKGDWVTVQLGKSKAAAKVSRFGLPDVAPQASPENVVGLVVALDGAIANSIADNTAVLISVTTDQANGVLAVPITALLAPTNGGYAIEVLRGKARHLVPVTVGLVDEADGLAEVASPEVHEGDFVSVPKS